MKGIIIVGKLNAIGFLALLAERGSIPVDQPELVVEAIREVVEAARR